MKKLFFIFVIFIFSAQFINAQESAKEHAKKAEEYGKSLKLKKEIRDSSQAVAKDTTAKKRAKVIPNLPGGNWEMYQNYLLAAPGVGQSLDKYIGLKRKIQTQSKSGSWTVGWLLPGTPLVVNEADKEKGEISNFFIFQCYNNSKVLGKTPLKLSELKKIVSYSELQQLQKGSGIAGIEKEDILKLSELLEKAFGDEGEIEELGDRMNVLENKVDVLGIDISSIRASLFGNQDHEEENFFSTLWEYGRWVLLGAACYIGGREIDRLFSKHDQPVINIYNSPTGPANPYNAVLKFDLFHLFRGSK